MLASETISGYLARARVLTSEMKAVGILLDMTLLMIIVLRGLPISPILPSVPEAIKASWVVDSGAAVHITPEVSTLHNYRATPFRMAVQLGDRKIHWATGYGDVHMQWGGAKFVVRDVWYVPGFKYRLLSVKKLTEKGGEVVFNKIGAYLSMPTAPKVLLGARGGVWFLDVDEHRSARGIAALTVKALRDNAQALLWHQRYGHLSYEGLAHLVEKGLVKGIPVKEDAFRECGSSVCGECVMSKQTRLPFPGSESKTSRKLELVHMDLFGPVSIPSREGHKYVATFVDDYSRVSAVVLLSSKDEVPKIVKLGLTILENRAEAKVKFVRTDRGSEYVNKELKEWYGQKGITDQTTAGYAPEQNGVAERLNRTLLDKARALLMEANLPLSFWGDAFIMASHLRNRSPVHKRDRTPWELFTGQVPDVSGFRVFGCRAYVHVPKQKRTKLGLTKFDSVARPGIYIGPAVNAKAYRILLDDGTVQISRDVTFDEFVRVKPEKPVVWEEDSPKVPAPEDEAAEERAEPAVVHEVPAPPAGQVAEEQADDPAAAHGDGAGSCGVRRSERVRKQPERFIAGSAALPVPPDNIEEAKSRPDWPMWKKACDEEIASLYGNNTWTLVQVSRATRVIGVKWVFSYKFDASGNIERYKARLFAKGYSQVAGIDFDEVFAPIKSRLMSKFEIRDLGEVRVSVPAIQDP
ncbi:hypothetical protein GPECTOR_56g359 [Gonium pectorale]|uniref:Integrase catalytic domain-containing protein n=1 Tax=Gonium pectorale TaxID=33097 RepID=A0A150G668_GONPE|nr:hypothetical protein GPECTOR_56g359 [Gonium pectorale]|eukprot:KXZ45263.1 hypothetical protein GPECTOR_56g359 [Gonium pectorale]